MNMWVTIIVRLANEIVLGRHISSTVDRERQRTDSACFQEDRVLLVPHNTISLMKSLSCKLVSLSFRLLSPHCSIAAALFYSLWPVASQTL